MKARIKATGEIISLDEKSTVLDANPCNFNSYEISELEILYENTNFSKNYWQKLEHTYAGMVMQGMMSGWWSESIANIAKSDKEHFDILVHKANELAHALVERMRKNV